MIRKSYIICKYAVFIKDHSSQSFNYFRRRLCIMIIGMRECLDISVQLFDCSWRSQSHYPQTLNFEFQVRIEYGKVGVIRRKIMELL